MERIKNSFVDSYQHYKYFHFYSICFGLGWVTALYSPFRPITEALVFGGVFTLMFELVGLMSSMPPQSATCKGPPYEKGDVYFGYFFAVVVAIINRKSYDACQVSCGCGLIMFAFRGVIRKRSFLRTYWDRDSWW